MELQTKYFGTIEVDETESLSFVSPVYGFESIQRYVLLQDDTTPESPFCWLQAVGRQDVCFVLTDPCVVDGAYRPVLSPQDREALGLAEGEAPVLRLVTILPEDFSGATVNLKSPVVINPFAKRAAQVMLEEDYPVRAPLLQEDALC